MTCSSAGITSDIPCVDVPACGRGGHDDGGGGALLLNWTTVGEGGGAAPAQQTRARVCWDEHGLAIRAAVDDASLCSPYTSCDDETYVGADVVEVFLTPTKNAPADAPDTYLELDVAHLRRRLRPQSLVRRRAQRVAVVLLPAGGLLRRAEVQHDRRRVQGRLLRVRPCQSPLCGRGQRFGAGDLPEEC